MLKTKETIAIAAIMLATIFLSACSGGGGGSGAPAANCTTAGCINGGRVPPGRFGGLATGTYIRGFASDGKVQLGISNAIAMAALCQQSIDSGRGSLEAADARVNYQSDQYYAGNPNYMNGGYQGYGLCTSLAQTILTFHYDQNSNVLRWRFYFNGVGSQIYQGQVQRAANGAFQAVSGSLVFTGLDTGAQLTVTLSAYNQPNAALASGTMTPSSN